MARPPGFAVWAYTRSRRPLRGLQGEHMEKSGLNLQTLRNKNKSLILYELNSNGEISRKELSARLSLTPAAVTKICAELIEEGLISQHGEIENSGRSGRKEILLSLRLSDKFTFGINAERNCVTYSVCDLSGKLYFSEVHELMQNVETVIEVGKRFMSCVPEKIRQKIIAMGVCVIGNVGDTRFGVWQDSNIREKFEASFGLECVIENNVKAFALAELIYGNVPHGDAVLYFKWGPGVGSAFSSGGSVLSGGDSGVAEIGHYIVDPGGEKCRCGRYGCLETVASENAIIKAAGDNYSFEQIAASETSEFSVLLDHKIDTVALALVNTATILNAKKIVLFGSIFAYENIKRKLIKQCLRYDPNLKERIIKESDLNEKNGYIGTVAVCAEKFFFERDNA